MNRYGISWVTLTATPRRHRMRISERSADARLTSTRMKGGHKMSESTNAFRRSLSLTTEKSIRMLFASEVSVILQSSEDQLRVT